MFQECAMVRFQTSTQAANDEQTSKFQSYKDLTQRLLKLFW